MKKIYVLIVSTLMAISWANVPVFAATNSCAKPFLGLVPWYNSLPMDADCNIETPSESEIPGYATKIILNILVDLSMLVGYITVVFVAWGGYLYMFSRGEPSRAERGKTTIISALIGLLIAVLANVIMRFASTVLLR